MRNERHFYELQTYGSTAGRFINMSYWNFILQMNYGYGIHKKEFDEFAWGLVYI
jgi:hypothetical protein